MTRFLFIRHGQSQANIEGFFAGHTDVPLTEKGMRQAELTAAYVTGKYSVDRVYASDLKRAYTTGQAVAKRIGVPCQAEVRLREVFAGEWEGVSFDELPNRPAYQVWMNNIGEAVCDGGESIAQLQHRVFEAIRQIAEENPEQTVVIATHATPIRTLQCLAEGKDLSYMKNIPWVHNASVSEGIFQDGRLSFVQIGYDKQLGDLSSQLPPNC